MRSIAFSEPRQSGPPRSPLHDLTNARTALIFGEPAHPALRLQPNGGSDHIPETSNRLLDIPSCADVPYLFSYVHGTNRPHPYRSGYPRRPRLGACGHHGPQGLSAGRRRAGTGQRRYRQAAHSAARTRRRLVKFDRVRWPADRYRRFAGNHPAEGGSVTAPGSTSPLQRRRSIILSS